MSSGRLSREPCYREWRPPRSSSSWSTTAAMYYSIVRGMARYPMELSHGQIEEWFSLGHSREPSGQEMLRRGLLVHDCTTSKSTISGALRSRIWTDHCMTFPISTYEGDPGCSKAGTTAWCPCHLRDLRQGEVKLENAGAVNSKSLPYNIGVCRPLPTANTLSRALIDLTMSC